MQRYVFQHAAPGGLGAGIAGLGGALSGFVVSKCDFFHQKLQADMFYGATPPPLPPLPEKAAAFVASRIVCIIASLAWRQLLETKSGAKTLHVTTLPFCLLQFTASNVAQPGRQHSRCK